MAAPRGADENGGTPTGPRQEEPLSMTTEQAAPAINAWEVAQRQFDLAAERLDLDPGLRAVLREPRRALTVTFPLIFVAERPTVLVPLAVALPLVQVPLAWGLEQPLGIDGLAVALALTTLLALGVLMAGLSGRTLALAAAGIGRLAVVLIAIAALSFGVLDALVGGIAAAALGTAVYVALLRLALPLGLRDAWAYIRALN